MSLKLITAPTEEPVTTAEAKTHCRVDDSTDDTLIAALIVVARQQAEHRTGRALVSQTWELALDEFPAVEIELPQPAVSSIISIKYLDENSVEQTIGASNYALDNYGIRHWVIPAYDYTWPSTLDSANAVKVRFVAGYGAAASVPQSLKSWILIAVATLYNQREGIVTGTTIAEVPRDFCAGLLDPYLVPVV